MLFFVLYLSYSKNWFILIIVCIQLTNKMLSLFFFSHSSMLFISTVVKKCNCNLQLVPTLPFYFSIKTRKLDANAPTRIRSQKVKQDTYYIRAKSEQTFLQTIPPMSTRELQTSAKKAHVYSERERETRGEKITQ